MVKNLPAKAGDIRDVVSTPGLGRSPGQGHGNWLQYSWSFPGGSDGKESSCNVEDPGLIPGLEERNGYPTLAH